MLVKILLTVGVLLVMFLVATRPVICVSRSATIPAPPAVVSGRILPAHCLEPAATCIRPAGYPPASGDRGRL